MRHSGHRRIYSSVNEIQPWTEEGGFEPPVRFPVQRFSRPFRISLPDYAPIYTHFNGLNLSANILTAG